MGKKVPKPPDYTAAAEKQADASEDITRDQTYANRPTQITPWGDVDWTTQAVIDPGSGEWTTRWIQEMSLDPDAQAALDDQQAITRGRSNLALSMLGRTQDEFGPMMDWNQFTPIQAAPTAPQYSTQGLQGIGPTGVQQDVDFSGAYQVGDPESVRQRAEDAIYGRASSRLDPMWGNRQSDLEIQLRNQGLSPQDEAYRKAMGEFERNRTDAYQTAMNEAIMGGGAESDRMFGQMMQRRGMDTGEVMSQGTFRNQAAEALFGQQGRTREQQLNEMLRLGNAQMSDQITAANYANTARQQQIAEQMQRRGFTLNEINAILTGQQVAQPSMPSFNTAERSETPQYLNAAQSQFQDNLASFNAEQQAIQGMMSGAGSMAGGMMMMSDRRLKDDVVRIGSLGKVGLYKWQWNRLAHMIGCDKLPNVGVIAQEVALVIPHAVHRLANGLFAVDYSKLSEAAA